MKKRVHTKNAPDAIGPYNQAIAAGGMLYISGQIPLPIHSLELVQGIENQTHQVMKNLQAILESEGSDFSKVVKSTIFLTDLNHFSVVNEIYGDYFRGTIFPARETVEVSGLPKGALIEISMIALAD